MKTTRISPWISVPLPNPEACARLICFPYAGAAAGIFHGWAYYLPSEIELWAVELPGRGSRVSEASFTSMPDLVDATAEALAPYLDLPFAFYGHSMGSMIAFELTRTLRNRYGIEPCRLVVSGRRAPHIPDTDPPSYNLPEAMLVEKLRRMNGTPREVLEHAEIMRLLVPILRADFEVCQTYRYESGIPLSVPIDAYGGVEDDGETPDLLEEWGLHTTGEFSLQLLHGDHFFLHSAQEDLLKMLSEQMRQVVNHAKSSLCVSFA